MKYPSCFAKCDCGITKVHCDRTMNENFICQQCEYYYFNLKGVKDGV